MKIGIWWQAMIQVMLILCPEVEERVYFNVQALQLLLICKQTIGTMICKKDCSDQLRMAVMPTGYKSIRKFQREGNRSFVFHFIKKYSVFSQIDTRKMWFRNVVLSVATHIHVIGFLTL